jgi:hypothetical protein
MRDEDLRGLATDGILVKCSSRSMAAFITYGVPLIRMATFWTSWSKACDPFPRNGCSFGPGIGDLDHRVFDN